MAQLTPSDINRPGLAGDPGVRARPDPIRDPTGSALMSFSRSMESVSNSFQAMAEARQESEDKVGVNTGQLELTKVFEPEIQSALSSPEAGRPDFINTLDGRLAKKQQEVYARLQAQGINLSKRGRQALDESASTLRLNAARRAAVEAHNQKTLGLYSTSENNVLDIGRQAASNGDVDGALARVEAEAEALRNVLAPDKHKAFLEASRSTVVEMTVRGLVERGEVDRAKAITNRYTGFAGQGADPIKQTIIAQAEAEGVDPAVALAIAGIESGFDPNAKNPKSSAGGLFQFITETGGQYGLPADARQASVEAQARAGAKFTVGNIAALRRGLGGAEPTPGETYLAHFLGAGGALSVLKTDPETAIDQVLSAKVIEANPHLRGMSAADVITWADGKMQTQMEAVATNKVLEGRDIAPNAASIPMDTAVKLNAVVNAKIEALRKEEEKRRERLFKMVDPTKPRKDKDPVQYVVEESRDANQAYADALAVSDPSAGSSFAEQRRAWEQAGDVALDEQAALGVQPHNAKVLPNSMAQSIVQSLVAMPSNQVGDEFLRLKERFGKHWNKAFTELAEQGLPASYQVMTMVEDNVVHRDLVAQTLNIEEKDLKEGLGSTVVTTDITDPLEDRIADFLGAFETGSFDPRSKMQSTAIAETLRKVALVHYRQFRDAGKAVEAAASIVESRFNVVEGSNVRVIVPVETQLSDMEVERAARIKQDRALIEGFNPVPVGSGAGDPGFLTRQRTIATAANSGVWVTNETGDGMILTVPFGVETATVPLLNENGDRYEVKFEEVRRILKEAPDIAAGRPSTQVFGEPRDLTPEEEALAMGRTVETQRAEAP